MLWLKLQKMLSDGHLSSSSRVLHIAPDKGIVIRLSGVLEAENYHTADLFPELYTKFAPETRRIDLCDLDDWSSENYDLIIHSHVLEHTPCNIAYTLYHLHRMLRQSGRHIFIVPLMGGKYEECFQDIPPEERRRRLSQEDHVRRFGKADIHAHLGSVLNLPDPPDAEAIYGANTLRAANIPSAVWTGYNGCTVFDLARSDMKFI
ncbi:MAG: hypothetical protein AAGF78_02980 [Pseudomonadota bacterium]